MLERIKPLLEQCHDDTIKNRIRIALEAAINAGKILNEKFGTSLIISNKGEIDLVTEADTAAEHAILEVITKNDGESRILAEESHSGLLSLSHDSVWIIDPLDGTTNFAHGFPWFAVSIGFACKGKIETGLIYAPCRDELFCASRGAGAWLNGKKISVSPTKSLNDSLLATGFPYDVRQHPEPVFGAMQSLITKCQGIRRAGAAALDLAYVSCGRLDGFWEIKLKPWDTAAGLLLVEEAGGEVTDFKGQAYSPELPEIVASNQIVHKEMTEILREFSVIK